MADEATKMLGTADNIADALMTNVNITEALSPKIVNSSATRQTVTIWVNGVLQNKTFQLEAYKTNGTIPWENREAMGELWQQWLKFKNLPRFWSLVIAALHAVLFMASALLRYPLWNVVATCAIVEAPQVGFRNDREHREEKKHDDERDFSNIVTQQRPVTSSLRIMLGTLYRIDGVASFYRGLAIDFCLGWTHGIVMVILVVTINAFLPGKPIPNAEALSIPDSTILMMMTELVADIISTMIFCSWMAAHTHIVITQPTLRIWYRRLPPWWKTLKSTWLSIVVEIVAYRITFKLPSILCRKSGLYDMTTYLGTNATGNALYMRRLAFVTIWLAAQLARLELLVPAQVAMTRVQASLLPDDEDTIVPLDRTFGAKTGRESTSFVPPGILAPSRGAISFWTAWRSYDRAERKRILFLYAKFVIMEAALLAAFSTVLGKGVWPGFWHPT